MPFVLLKCIAKAVIKNVGNLFGFGVAGSIVVDAWEFWEKEPGKQADQVEIQATAQISPTALNNEVMALLQAEAPQLSAAEQKQVLSVMKQVPAMVRRSLRRSSDPTGRTVPTGLRLQKADDLYAFVPPRLPQFKENDRPLGKWVLVELLGIGGFGEVWRAHHVESPGIRAALKFCTGPQAAKIGKHEVQIVDQVMQRGKQPGIVELRNYDLEHTPPWLEYELIEGGEFGSWILEQHRINGKIAPDLAAKVMLHLAKIMAFAHRPAPRSIVHRDLKPANILVSRTVDNKLTLKIADFGIGRIAASQSLGQYTQGGANPDERMTCAVRGAYSLLYAPRQQVDGCDPDPKDDVYALGVIWSQLLTGKLDKGAPSFGDAGRARLRQLGLTDPAIQLLAECVEPESEDRLESAIVLEERLADLLKGPPPPKPSVRIELLQPQPLSVVAGSSATAVVRVARQHFDGALTVVVEDLPTTLACKTSPIGVAGLESQIELTADTTAAAGTTNGRIVVRGNGVQDQVILTVRVSVAPGPTPRPGPVGVVGGYTGGSSKHPKVNLRVTPDDALALISQIPHSKCQRAVPNNWKLVGGKVTAQSVDWLYCWAKTGMNSQRAADAAREVFDEIFDMTFEEYDSQVDHDEARRDRYRG